MPNFPFENIETAVDHARGHVAQWRLSQNYRGVPPIKTWLQVAESADFKTLKAEIPSETFYAVDTSHTQQDWKVPHIYRIRLRDSLGVEVVSDPFPFDLDRIPRSKYLLASEIVRREYVRLQYVGQSGWLLKHRNFGVQATQDVDPVTGVVLTDNPTSFGTGFNGGYYPAVRMLFSQEDYRQETKLDEQGLGVKHVETVSLRSPCFPDVDVHDIVVSAAGKRWYVADVQTHWFPGTRTALMHTSQCRVVPCTDSVYHVPVPAV